MADKHSGCADSIDQSRRRFQVFSGTAIAISLLTLPLHCAKSVNSASPQTQDIFEPAEVRALSGQLDSVPRFNSDSPEWIRTPRVLLSTFMQLSSRGPVYLADLAMYAPQTQTGQERSPTLAEWQAYLKHIEILKLLPLESG
jgi:hypothetical protein